MDEDIKDAARRAFAPPESETVEEDRALSLAERLFDFPKGVREKAIVSSWSGTESFRSGLAAIAEASGLSAIEVIRRGVFAIASRPELLHDDEVERLERRYEALLGAGGRRTHSKPKPP